MLDIEHLNALVDGAIAPKVHICKLKLKLNSQLILHVNMKCSTLEVQC